MKRYHIGNNKINQSEKSIDKRMYYDIIIQKMLLKDAAIFKPIELRMGLFFKNVSYKYGVLRNRLRLYPNNLMRIMPP